jgi:hypothetical protein
MASFVNHKSSVSALQAKLGAFARELDETTVLSNGSTSTAGTHFFLSCGSILRKYIHMILTNDSLVLTHLAVTKDASSSHDFLEEQEMRLLTVEQNLLRATDYILPREETNTRANSSSQMTISELTHILESLHDLQSSQISRLEEMVGLKEKETEDSQQPTPEQYSRFAGRPLAAVMETDQETDASRTTPGSLAFMSPDYGYPAGKIGSLTPETPTISFQELRLSASTVSILEQETRNSVGKLQQTRSDHIVETAATTTTAKLNRTIDEYADDEASSMDKTSSGGDESFDEGHTIATVPTVVAEGRQPRLRLQSPRTRDQDDDDDEETCDFDEGHTIATVATVVAEGRQPRLRLQSPKTRDQDDDGETCDDSAMYCPTVVASDRVRPIQTRYQDDEETCDDSAVYCPTVVASDRVRPGKSLSELVRDDHANSPSGNPYFTHIEVDYGFLSPTPTNLTMDTAAFLNETVGQLDTVFELEDNSNVSVSSDETPVLDRYRIDRDENSPNGFRVVPNQRGRHATRNTHSGVTPVHEKRETSPGFAPNPMSAPSSNRRPKQVFRRTPHPKKKVPSTPTIDENTPFNGSMSPPVRPIRPLESPLASFSPLRALASPRLERTRLSYPISHQEERTNTLPPSLLYAKAALEMKNPGSSRPLGRTVPSLSSRSGLDAVHGHHHIRPVPLSEYENGPRVVKMQVSFEELEGATVALNDALRQRKGARAMQLEHLEANQILQPLGISERKSRSILMTLCHFRRLMMQRCDKRHSLLGEDKNQKIVFDVVTA